MLINLKLPLTTTSTTAICVCKAKPPTPTSHISTASLSLITLPLSRCKRRSSITSKPCNDKPSCWWNKSTSKIKSIEEALEEIIPGGLLQVIVACRSLPWKILLFREPFALSSQTPRDFLLQDIWQGYSSCYFRHQKSNSNHTDK